MPDRKRIVINTGPILAIISAFDDLAILQKLYRNVLVPLEVCREIEAGGRNSFGAQQFNRASWLTKYTSKQPVSDFLKNSLDEGEASVIQLAIEQNISTVCLVVCGEGRSAMGAPIPIATLLFMRRNECMNHGHQSTAMSPYLH